MGRGGGGGGGGILKSGKRPKYGDIKGYPKCEDT